MHTTHRIGEQDKSGAGCKQLPAEAELSFFNNQPNTFFNRAFHIFFGAVQPSMRISGSLRKNICCHIMSIATIFDLKIQSTVTHFQLRRGRLYEPTWKFNWWSAKFSPQTDERSILTPYGQFTYLSFDMWTPFHNNSNCSCKVYRGLEARCKISLELWFR